MDDAVKLIRDLGFPAAVAFFVLWRVDTALRDLSFAVRDLIAYLKRRSGEGGE